MQRLLVRAQRRRLGDILVLTGLAAACSHNEPPPMQPAASISNEAPKPVATAKPVPIAPPTAPAATEPPNVDPPDKITADPMAALERMGAYLRALPAFSVEAETTKDEVLESGEKIQFQKSVSYKVRKPSSLRVNVSSPLQYRSFYYDGKTFTIYARKLGYYASFDAPPTFKELVRVADEKYDIDMPLADLFYFGTEDTSAGDITSASYVGPAEIRGTLADHYAFRQKDIDWQLWIERGAKPLPRKLFIITKDETREPEFSAVLKWNTQPNLSDSDFAFVPAKGAQRIEFALKKAPAK